MTPLHKAGRVEGWKGGVRVPALAQHPTGQLGEAAPSSRFGDIWRGTASLSMSLPHLAVLGNGVTGLPGLQDAPMLDWDPCLTLEAQGGIFHPAIVPREHLYAPGNLGAGMELSMAPLEGNQGWRCPCVPSRNSV